MVDKTITLNTGAKMPLFGLGTYLSTNADELKVAIRTALDNGYRLLDTASVYQNESVIGEVLQEYFQSGKLKREELFITTKLPFHAMAPEEAEKMIPEQLAALQLDYVDLFLIHTPTPMKPKDWNDIKPLPGYFDFYDVPHIDTWRVLEKFHKKGVLKAIGLSNFNEQQITRLLEKAEVVPANLQCECTVYWPQFELHEFCKKRGITFTAYSPLGNPGLRAILADLPQSRPLDDPLLKELAQKYGKTVAQVIFRYMIQRGISVIPKSTTPSRVIENGQIYDFALSEEDIERINQIKKRVRLVEFLFAYGHKEFPFLDVKPRAANNDQAAF